MDTLTQRQSQVSFNVKCQTITFFNLVIGSISLHCCLTVTDDVPKVMISQNKHYCPYSLFKNRNHLTGGSDASLEQWDCVDHV